MWLALGLCAVTACGRTPPPQPEALQPSIEELEAEVLGADVAMDLAVQDGDLDLFADLIAEDAVFYGSVPMEGREQVVSAWSAFFEPSAESTITWSPQKVEVAASGDLAYTRGAYRMTVHGNDGATGLFGGSYVTVWRRSPDGKWRAALDIGTPSQAIASE
jgi:uncharacterized protein (TIGR02246 family)